MTFVAALVVAAARDVRTMRIGNAYPIAIVVLFTISATSGVVSGERELASVAAAVACAMLVLAVGALAFAAGVFGGGDVKLLAAASLFSGPDRLFDFLTVTALAGGGLAVALLAVVPIANAAGAPGTALRARLHTHMPYGPAIAAGGLWLAATSTWG